MADRPFTKLHTPLLDHDKWLGLSYPAKAAWYSLLHLSGRTHGTFKGEPQAVGLLRREGHLDPAPAVAELIEAHLLDEGDEGELVLHDFLDWQPLWRGPSDATEALAARQRASRASRGVTNGHERVTRGHDAKRQEGEGDRDSPTTDVVGSLSRGVTTGHDKPPTPRQAALATLKALGYRTPSGWAAPIFGELVAKFEPARLAEVLSAGKASGVTMTNKLVGYAERELSGGSPRPTNGHRPGATKPGELTVSREGLASVTRSV